MAKQDAAFRAWFERELRHLHQTASEWITAGKTVPPVFLVFGDDNECAIFPVPSFANVTDKNRVAALHWLLGKAGTAVFMSECWTLNATFSPEDAERLRTSKEGIEHDPERTESVMWSAIKGKRQLIALAPILRPSNMLGPAKIIDSTEGRWRGRFVNER